MSDKMAAAGAFGPYGTARLPERQDSKLQASEVQIYDLQRQPDWDGDGAEGISRATCQAAVEFLRRALQADPHLPSPTSIAPSVLGSISFSWDAGQVGALTVEVISPTAERLYHQWLSAEGEYRQEFAHEHDILQRLRTLYA